tara:strand:- start:181 stop:690 length:510 start_codon:yes stop_codon:yes gene_type:complete
MSKDQRGRMPHKGHITKYWSMFDGAKTFVKKGLLSDDGWTGIIVNEDSCWACGWGEGVQRCHIIAVSLGGSHHESNLHILCRNCHVASECLSEEAYWVWLKEMSSTKYIDPAIRHNEFLEMIGIDRKMLLSLVDSKDFKGLLSYLLKFFDESVAESYTKDFRKRFSKKD